MKYSFETIDSIKWLKLVNMEFDLDGSSEIKYYKIGNSCVVYLNSPTLNFKSDLIDTSKLTEKELEEKLDKITEDLIALRAQNEDNAKGYTNILDPAAFALGKAKL